VSDADAPGFRVAGNASPEIENPFPLTVAALMVSAAVPVEVSVTVLLFA
jgi:hypothetical protein